MPAPSACLAGLDPFFDVCHCPEVIASVIREMKYGLCLAWLLALSGALNLPAGDFPAASDEQLEIGRGLGHVTLSFSNRVFAANQLFASSDLVSWTSVDWLRDAAPPLYNSVTTAAALPWQFFRLSQVQYGASNLNISHVGLVGYWPLEGDWRDVMGGLDLAPVRAGGFSGAPQLRPWNNRCYGPTQSPTNNGASRAGFTGIPEDQGLTLDGWAWLPDNDTAGVLFGFGDLDWSKAKCNVFVSWGYLYAGIGKRGDGVKLRYSRIGNQCWHHLALVLPRNFRTGIPLRFYVDGSEVAPAVDTSQTGGAYLGPAATLFGEPFQIGDFVPSGDTGSSQLMKVDEVRIWARELNSSEIAVLAIPTGAGSLCQNVQTNSSPTASWAPGPRFVPPGTMPAPALTLGVRVLTADTLCVVTDPNPWLKERLAADCGAYLRAMETNRQSVADWLYSMNYQLAAKEVIIHYRPSILAALPGPAHFRLSGPGLDFVPLGGGSLWPQATREFRIPCLGIQGGEIHGDSCETVFFSFYKLPAPMVRGEAYRVTDRWGNTATCVFDEDQTLSWALKVNQVGYLQDAPLKYGYLGGWLGPAGGALAVSNWIGKSFNLCRQTDATPVFTNTIEFRRDETQPTNGFPLSGELVCQLDFSSFTHSGRYFLRVPGLGRSWDFEIGQNAMGEAFYVHARGLYHQRCGALATNFTFWPRGDNHGQTLQAAFPTEANAYSDHSAEGWGFLDAGGRFPQDFNWFDVVAATATTHIIPGLSGGWHDAADFDRRASHLFAVEDLAESYLMFPENFTDGQLHLPESGNGIPDILDEAAWGMEVWRKAQQPDGRVALWIDSTRHPQASDPARDNQPYYLGLASHNSSIQYAEHAARLARALSCAGAAEKGRLFLESARRAYGFGSSSGPRISVSMILGTNAVTWTEPAAPDPGAKVKALVQLWLATGDAAYYDALNTPAMAAAFSSEVRSLYWRGSSFDFVDVALAPDQLPAGWADTARDGIRNTAADWLRDQELHAHRKLWHGPLQGYYKSGSWGADDFKPIRHLIAAWRLSGESRFRVGALLAVDWMHGANPQGRVNTTGLGRNYVVHPLHLPSDSDGIADPVPGLTIYGYSSSIVYQARTRVYGLFEDGRPAEGFAGSALAQLPPPWNDVTMSLAAIGDVLYANLPLWRLLISLEGANPPQMEFTVDETTAAAAAVAGCLMGSGWEPSPALVARPPRTAAELHDSLWFQP